MRTQERQRAFLQRKTLSTLLPATIKTTFSSQKVLYVFISLLLCFFLLSLYVFLPVLSLYILVSLSLSLSLSLCVCVCVCVCVGIGLSQWSTIQVLLMPWPFVIFSCAHTHKALAGHGRLCNLFVVCPSLLYLFPLLSHHFLLLSFFLSFFFRWQKKKKRPYLMNKNQSCSMN